MKKVLGIIGEIDAIQLLLVLFVVLFLFEESLFKTITCSILFIIQLINFIANYVGVGVRE